MPITERLLTRKGSASDRALVGAAPTPAAVETRGRRAPIRETEVGELDITTEAEDCYGRWRLRDGSCDEGGQRGVVMRNVSALPEGKCGCTGGSHARDADAADSRQGGGTLRNEQKNAESSMCSSRSWQWQRTQLPRHQEAVALEGDNLLFE